MRERAARVPLLALRPDSVGEETGVPNAVQRPLLLRRGLRGERGLATRSCIVWSPRQREPQEAGPPLFRVRAATHPTPRRNQRAKGKPARSGGTAGAGRRIDAHVVSSPIAPRRGPVPATRPRPG